MTWRWLLVLTVTWGVASPDPRFNMDPRPATLAVSDKAGYRLPVGPTPSHYEVYLAYDINPQQEFPFYGLVKIQLSSNISTSEIVLHAQDLNIVDNEVSLQDKSGQKNTIESIEKKTEYHFLIIKLKEAIHANTNYELTIPFWGNLKGSLDGAYISSYDNAKTGEKDHLVTTQFEAISARKAFPCFDEPDKKATFAIHLAHHKDYVAISNMPVSNQSTKENLLASFWSYDTMARRFGSQTSVITDSWVWDSFASSVPMSTYLVAWVISKFGHITSPPGLSHVNFRIWARKDALSQAEYASVIGPKVLSFYESWFNVSFPLPKQDMIAIPDFSAGAMENWGLVTYRETALLYDPGRSSQINKERVAEVVAHELAHQWFGNLVTMEWWTDLWLNEGFATYMAILGVDAIEPSWDTTISSVVDNTRSVLSLDALRSSHPISVTVQDPKMIDEIFDTISYSKGAMLIYMMNMFLGEDIFRQGINRYLVSHSYKNADQSKLWSALSSAAAGSVKLPKGKTVGDIMDTWTLQSGYPLIQVTRNYNRNALTVTQHRFLSLNQSDAEDQNSAWWVPLSILTEAEIGREKKPLSWLAPTEGIEEPKQLNHDANDFQWILFNVDMIAPLRVTYDDRNWGLLIDALIDTKKYKQIPVLSRVQLLDDSFALAKASRLPYETTLRLASYLKHEEEYEPLDTGLSVLGYIQRLLARDADFGVIRAFLRDLITPRYAAVGGLTAKPRENKEIKMQVLASNIACRVGAGDCEEAALKMLEQWMTNPESNPISQDLRSVVYCTAIRRGGANHWEFLNEQRKKSNLATEQVTLMRALSCSRQVWILKRYLEWALTGQEDIRSQDAASVISGVTSNPEGFSIARDFVFERIEELHQRFSGQKRRIGGIISSVLRHFTTDKELHQFLQWQEENAQYLDESKLSVKQAIESAKINIDWTSRFKNSVVQIMKELQS